MSSKKYRKCKRSLIHELKIYQDHELEYRKLRKAQTYTKLNFRIHDISRSNSIQRLEQKNKATYSLDYILNQV